MQDMPIALPKKNTLLFFFTLYTFFPVSSPHLFSATRNFIPGYRKPSRPPGLSFSGCSALPAHFSHLPFYSTLPPTHFIKTLPPHAQLLRTAYVSLTHYASFRSSLLSIVSKKQPRAIINRPGSKKCTIYYFLRKNFLFVLSHIYGKRECFSLLQKEITGTD